MASQLERRCREKGLKMTGQRRVIAQVLSESDDHPDVETLYQRASRADPRISIATVYRTVKLFEQANILTRHEFGDGRARYETVAPEHHDHLIDVDSGQVIEFRNDEIERLQRDAARALGYRLVGHRLELYGVRIQEKKARKAGATRRAGNGSPSVAKPG
ncbi:MAG TPA: Fur family transcriptional regulator [Kiloniellales bacterium]